MQNYVSSQIENCFGNTIAGSMPESGQKKSGLDGKGECLNETGAPQRSCKCDRKVVGEGL